MDDEPRTIEDLLDEVVELRRRIGAVGDHQHQCVAHCIVVEGRQELRCEQRAKAPRDEKRKRARRRARCGAFFAA